MEYHATIHYKDWGRYLHVIMNHGATQHEEFGPICAEKGIDVSMCVWICLYVRNIFWEDIQKVVSGDYLWSVGSF